MNPLLEVYQLLAQQGPLDAGQLQQRCRLSPAMLAALLTQLERMNRIVPVPADTPSCATGSCGNCPAHRRCAPVRYRACLPFNTSS